MVSRRTARVRCRRPTVIHRAAGRGVTARRHRRRRTKGVLMARLAIDAPTLLRLVTSEHVPDVRHQLVAPSSVRADALDLLMVGVRRGDMEERVALQLHERMTE